MSATASANTSLIMVLLLPPLSRGCRRRRAGAAPALRIGRQVAVGLVDHLEKRLERVEDRVDELWCWMKEMKAQERQQQRYREYRIAAG
jgi:TolA-binding protein